MWKLLRTELRYNGPFILLSDAVAFVFFAVIWFYVSRRNRVPIQMLILLVLVFFISYTGRGKKRAQRRDRMHVRLPVPLKTIALLRLAYPLALWLNALALFGIGLLIVSFMRALLFTSPFRWFFLQSPSLAQLITLNGWILLVNAVLIIAFDMEISTSNKAKWTFFKAVQILISFIAIAPFYIIMDFGGWFTGREALRTELSALTGSTTGMILFNLLGALLTVLGLWIFRNRTSYTDS